MMRLVRITRGAKRVVLASVLATTAIACSKKDEVITDPKLSDEIASVAPLAPGMTFAAPMDGAPDPEGKTVVFTALTDEGAAVFRIAVTGGAPTRIAVGEPLTSPFGIVFSSDGTRVYVADSGAEDDQTKGVGRLFGLPAEGGTIDSLAAAEGLSPRSLDLVSENNVDVIYFTGLDEHHAAAVFKINADGSNLTTVTAGAPLVDPSGITVDAKGVVYVADSSAENGATVFKIENGVVSELASEMRFGHPAGIALVPSESAVLVSGLDRVTARSTVYKVEVATGNVASFNDGIGQNGDSAGLHRARKAAVYAWANAAGETQGETVVPGGTVYVLKGK